MAEEKKEGVVENPWGRFEEKLDSEIPTATLQVYRQVEKDLMADRQDPANINRASAMNYCERRRWYQKNGEEGTPLTPRKILNFALGDMGEYVVKHFILKGCVGPGKLYSEVDFGEPIGTFTVQHKEVTIYTQQTVKAVIGGIEVTGHADGWGKRNADGVWENLEVKTAAPYGYEKFVSDGPQDYLEQAHALMLSDLGKERGVTQTRFFYMNKATGHIWDRVEPLNLDIVAKMEKEIRLANGVDIRPRPKRLAPEPEMTGRKPNKKPTGRTKLLWYCGYCPYVSTCYKSLVKEFKSGRPVLYVKLDEEN
jgi:hypothetical protein